MSRADGQNARHGIYTIIDLHAAPGGQNFDWHSDNNLPEALLFEFKEFQDRTVRIWEAIAERYKRCAFPPTPLSPLRAVVDRADGAATRGWRATTC